jgi:hypothetical protein
MSADEERADARRSSRRLGVAQASGLLAMVISVFALGTSIYQTRVMQSQARASVWPYVTLGASYYDTGEAAGFKLKVFNHGVGPALLKSIRMSIDGKPIRNWDEYLKVIVGRMTSESTHVITSNFVAVLPPDTNRETEIDVISLAAPEDASKAFAAMNRLELAACYCSVYEDCWIAHIHSKAVDTVPSCPAPDPNDFQS